MEIEQLSLFCLCIISGLGQMFMRFNTALNYLLGKGGYVFGSIGLSVCLFVCGQHYSKSYERNGMKCCGGVLGSTMKH